MFPEEIDEHEIRLNYDPSNENPWVVEVCFDRSVELPKDFEFVRDNCYYKRFKSIRKAEKYMKHLERMILGE